MPRLSTVRPDNRWTHLPLDVVANALGFRDDKVDRMKKIMEVTMVVFHDIRRSKWSAYSGLDMCAVFRLHVTHRPTLKWRDDLCVASCGGFRRVSARLQTSQRAWLSGNSSRTGRPLGPMLGLRPSRRLSRDDRQESATITAPRAPPVGNLTPFHARQLAEAGLKHTARDFLLLL
jgi:hypothetical protein